MAAVDFVLRHVIDDDGFAVLADFIADRRLDPELASRPQAESDVGPDAAGNPFVSGHSRNGSEAHAGRPADHVKDCRHGWNPANSLDISPEITRHLSLVSRSIPLS